MPDPSSAPVPGDHDNDPMPAWPLAEGARPASPVDPTPDRSTPPADGLVEETAASEEPDEQAPPPADGVLEPTPTVSPLADTAAPPTAPPQPTETATPVPIASNAATETLDDEPFDASDEDESDDSDGRDDPPRRGGLLTKEVRIDAKTLLALIGAVVLVGVAFAAYKVGQRADDAAAGQATTTTAYRVPAEFVLFSDPETGVKLSYPRNWERRSTLDLSDKSLRLVAGIPNSNDSVSLRTTAYSTEITAENLNDQKNVVDGLLGGEAITVLVDQTMTLRGMPALFYVYRFTDEPTGKTGIHAHFFVYQGRKMVSMVFQALPEDRYKLLAGTFDAIANTLEVAPGPPPAFLEELATTTTAPATTAPATTAAPATTVP